MASYPVSAATAAWQTAPAPTAAAWFQPIGGKVYVSTDTTANKATAGVISDGALYPVLNGTALKYALFDSTPVSVRLWDQ